jgi:hypothetical protein
MTPTSTESSSSDQESAAPNRRQDDVAHAGEHPTAMVRAESEAHESEVVAKVAVHARASSKVAPKPGASPLEADQAWSIASRSFR